jgi:hypothetical protein
VHDGSESTDDSFSVKVTVSDEKESAPVDIEVKINPVNNQKPLVVRNTGIKVWKGGIGLITSDNLSELCMRPFNYILILKKYIYIYLFFSC